MWELKYNKRGGFIMPSVVELLEKKGLIHPPSWMADNVHYEVDRKSVV